MRVFSILGFSAFLSACASEPTLDRPVRELIGEARAIASGPGNRVWPDYSSAPFGVLLVEGDGETLFCHVGPAAGFGPARRDRTSGCRMQTRSRRFSPSLLATFPAVDGRPTIVLGTPAATNRAPNAWMVTVLHEHFHQMQTSQPGYYAGVEALNLHGGDDTGMWMLNYDFPYSQPGVPEVASLWARTLLATLDAWGSADFEQRLEGYRAIRATMAARVSPADWRYAEFQLWQEGVALWTELAIAREGQLGDQVRDIEDRIRRDLTALDLASDQRVAFYALGAAEAELMNRIDPSWREAYFAEPFALGPILERMATAQR